MTELLRSSLPGYQALEDLALNLRWSWSHAADRVWEELDADLWKITQNPWVVLQTVSFEKLESCLADPQFAQVVNAFVLNNRKLDASYAWFQNKFPNSALKSVAYFSLEYMLCEALPIYSGGLGNVAGDQLKAASDLGVPVHAVGLLYQQGYFRQVIDQEGNQQALYPYNDPGQLPITPLRTKSGEWLRIKAFFPGFSVWLRTWQVKVGRVHLYLLDSNDPANFPAHRGITSELYGGGPELRLQQELILGIGGWRLLKALEVEPEVCHLNEGHAAFAILERAYSYMNEHGKDFEYALEATRAGNIFTTHTAVPAGFDRFSPDLMEKYLGRYARDKLKIPMESLLALGREHADDPQEHFNMAYFSIRGSSYINGVSRLHAEVSKRLFSPLFPRWPLSEVPIGYVTNGVHMPSWDSAEADQLWTDSCGKERWLGGTENLEKKVSELHSEPIWKMRNSTRNTMIAFIRERLALQFATTGKSEAEIERAKRIFDPGTLTLGFARRFATYKRPNILLTDPERLVRILNNPHFPVQLVLAGKAHPADKPGQEMIKQWIRFIEREDVRDKVVFLSDYDVNLTEQLVSGVDVWLNTPRRPWEACGTSGMKVLVNGGLNLSELDGWWAEAYTPEVGFALGDGQEHDDASSNDLKEAEELYHLLESQVIPLFYKRNAEGLPEEWVAKIRNSMATLTPRFSSNRSVREYTERYYLPAAENYLKRIGNGVQPIDQILAWRKQIKEKWGSLRFTSYEVKSDGDLHHFEATCYLDSLSPDSLQVSLFAEAPAENHPMKKVKPLQETPGMYLFQASIQTKRPTSDYTPRIEPFFEGLSIPIESSLILWEN